MGNRYQNNKSAITNKRRICIFLLLAAVCLSIKYIFMDFGIDAGFQVSMSYRLVKGDLMFREMWEPHQMSTFLTALFIKIYLALFKTTTGIVLYLQAVGVLIDWMVAYLLYKTAARYLMCRESAFAMAWFFVVVSPKDVPLPEFANMQIWFGALLCLALFMYHATEKKRYLVMVAFCLCAAVLSYSYCAILVAGVAFPLFFRGRYSSHSEKESVNWKKEFLLFMAVCAVAGICYLCLTLRHISPEEFSIFFESMFALEPSHSVGYGQRFLRHLLDAVKMAVLLAAGYGTALVSAGALVKVRRAGDARSEYNIIGDSRGILADVLFFLLMVCVSLYAVFSWENYTRYGYSFSFLAVILIGARHAKKLSGDKKFFYLCGNVITTLNFFATLLLSDSSLIGTIPYLITAVVVAFLPIGEALRQTAVRGTVGGNAFVRRLCITAMAVGTAFLVFKNVYLFRPLIYQANTIFEVGGIVKEGPAVGIITNYMGAYIQNESIKEWKEYIKEGSRIYIVGDLLDTLGYLYLDTEIAAPSVMCTPWYNESILEYWKMNPDKYPDVVIASCWYGDMNDGLEQNGWILKWIEEDFQPAYYVDGKYWRYYFKIFSE